MEQIEFQSLDQQMAVFGIHDGNIRILEDALSVSIQSRDTFVAVSGASERSVEVAAETLRSLQRAYDSGETINTDTVYRMLELAQEGGVEETLRAMADVVVITHRGQPIKCKTVGQKSYVKALQDNTVVIGIGPAGTGKTFLAVAQAVQELKRGEIERIIMSRPAIEAGEERLGFLPGDLAQKVDPYLRPLYDALNDILGAEHVKKYQERGVIEIAPLAYMRGRTLNRARVIIDESQNASLPTLKMALTRLGEGSKMVLTGDVTQIDLPRLSDSGLEKCASILHHVEDIAVVRLTNRDVIRHKLVRDIVKAFDKYEEKQQDKKSRPTMSRRPT